MKRKKLGAVVVAGGAGVAALALLRRKRPSPFGEHHPTPPLWSETLQQMRAANPGRIGEAYVVVRSHVRRGHVIRGYTRAA